jgi:hypothetical protein
MPDATGSQKGRAEGASSAPHVHVPLAKPRSRKASLPVPRTALSPSPTMPSALPTPPREPAAMAQAVFTRILDGSLQLRGSYPLSVLKTTTQTAAEGLARLLNER